MAPAVAPDVASTPYAPPSPAAYPAPPLPTPLPTPTINDGGQPPIEVDDPFNENDPNRTPANMLSDARIQAILDNEESPFWVTAHRQVFGIHGGTLQDLARERSELDRDVRTTIFRHTASPVTADGRKLLALTFDDGPHVATTQLILDVLKQYRCPATFFFVGEMAVRHPDLVRAAFRAGHSVGNHTFHHLTLVKLSEGDAVTEIMACGNILHAITGVTPHLFRPPGGTFTTDIAEDAALLGYTTVLWTGDAGDYERLHPAVIAQRTLKCARPGGIIILHSGVLQTVRALPYIIESLRNMGYTLVTVDQMLQSDGGGRTADAAPRLSDLVPAAAAARRVTTVAVAR